MAFGAAHQHRWPVAAMCRAIDPAERTSYAAKARPASRRLSDEELVVNIRRVWEANYRA